MRTKSEHLEHQFQYFLQVATLSSSILFVQLLLRRTHAMLPLEILRDGDVLRVADKEYDLLSVEVGLGVELTGVILDVIVVGEKNFGNLGIPAVIVLKAQEHPVRNREHQLVVAGDHHSEPRPTTLAKGYDRYVGSVEP